MIHHAQPQHQRIRQERRGNILVGCLTVLGVVLVLGVLVTVFVLRSYRGIIATGIENGLDATMSSLDISDSEQTQIRGHVERLLEKYTSKEIGNAEFFGVFEEIIDSPLVAAAMVGVIDNIYIEQSNLSEDEQEAANVELHRYAIGLYDERIDTDTLSTVFETVSTDDPDDDDIRLQYRAGPDGTTEYALRSNDEVSDDDLREMIARAKAAADEAGVEASPEKIDLSDTIGVTIAEALGEDPTAWVPGYQAPALPDGSGAGDDAPGGRDDAESDEPSDDQEP